MMLIGVGLMVVGCIGIAASTWLCPVIARLLFHRRLLASSEPRLPELSARQTQGGGALPGEGKPVPPGRARPHLCIALPAHNEETLIGPTIESIQAAVSLYQDSYDDCSIDIVVGDDASRDETARRAEQAGAAVLREPEQRGKWTLLQRFTREARDADWIAFVDAGAEWPPHILLAWRQALNDPAVMGVAPSYRRAVSGVVEHGLWWLERGIKQLENAVGGPVSVHGATVFYRRAELRQCFEFLGPTSYHNDDVVIPLTLRRLYPNGCIRYLDKIIVIDRSPAGRREIRRRRRLVRGNIESLELPRPRLADSLVEILFARRVCRVLWVYWVGIFLLGLLILGGTRYAMMSVMAVGIVGLGAALLLRRTAIGAAAIASGEALPRLLRRHSAPQQGGDVVWR